MANTSDFLIKYNPQGGIDTAHSGYSPQVQKLAATVNKQKEKLGATGGGSPSILGRIFDTISRPLYTVANTVDSVVQNKNPLEGAWRGLSGQDKTTFDKVLGDMGMTGGFQRALLGFGLDVVADPTTYIGAGLVKDAGVGVARKIGTEAVLDVGKEATQKVAREAVLDAIKNKTVVGDTIEKVLAQTPKDSLNLLKEGEHYVRDLKDYTPNLYRETNVQGLKDTLSSPESHIGNFWANKPELALGQGENKGILLELDSKGIQGSLSKAKPGWDFNYGQGNAEFVSSLNSQDTIYNNIRKATFNPAEITSTKDKIFAKSYMDQFKSEGFKEIQNADGTITFAKQADKTIQNQILGSLTAAEKRSVGQQAIQDHLATVARTAEDKALQEGRGRVFLKFMGKEVPGVIPKPAGEALYGLGTKAAELAAKSPSLVKVGQAVRPVMNFKHGTNDLLRESIGHAFFDGEEYIRGLKTQFGHLGEGERKIISHAIESGEDLSKHVVSPVELKMPNGTTRTMNTLEDYKSLAIDKMDALHQTEAGLGMVGQKSNLVNYVPHIYQTGDREAAAAFKAERKKLQSAFLKSGETNPLPVVKTLKQATEKGLKPKEDILESLAHRAVDSFRNQGQVRFAHAVENEFGVNLGKGLKGQVNQKNIGDLAKKLGVVEGKGKYLSDKGIYFHPDVAKTLKTVDRVITDPAAGSEVGRLFDKVQQAWKLNMTALNPGHHIRNFAGDVFLNFEDGVVNAARYTESAKILKNWRENPAAVAIQVGEKRLNAQQVMDLFSSKGGKSGFFRTELASSGIKPVEKIRELAETREDWTRLAHFIDVLKKEGKNVKSFEDLDKVASTAGKRVRKFNIDYGDLTPFERNGLKRVAPFYTWMRKNLPVQLETLALNPGKINAVPKFLNFLNSATGQQGQDPSLFGLNLTPLWLRQMASVRIAGEGQGRNGVYWNPSVIPFMDIGQYSEGGTSGILSSILGATSPFIRTPVELATGRSLLSGGPLQDTGMGYAGQNLIPPSWTRAKDIATGQGDMTDTAKLLGLSLQNVGDPQMKGELRRQQDPLQVRIKNMKAQLASEYAKRQNAKSA